MPPTAGLTSLTLSGAALSSTYSPHAASFAIDGNPNTFCHSTESTTPWLSVQMAQESNVSYILLHNRVDCCQDRLSPFQLWVGASSGDYNSATSTRCGVANASPGGAGEDLTAPATLGPFSFPCTGPNSAPLLGRYVTLVLTGSSRTLNIGELQPYGP